MDVFGQACLVLVGFVLVIAGMSVFIRSIQLRRNLNSHLPDLNMAFDGLVYSCNNFEGEKLKTGVGGFAPLVVAGFLAEGRIEDMFYGGITAFVVGILLLLWPITLA